MSDDDDLDKVMVPTPSPTTASQLVEDICSELQIQHSAITPGERRKMLEAIIIAHAQARQAERAKLERIAKQLDSMRDVLEYDSQKMSGRAMIRQVDEYTERIALLKLVAVALRTEAA